MWTVYLFCAATLCGVLCDVSSETEQATVTIDNELCRNHSQFYADNVYKLTFWALKMLDSTSKVPVGVLAGNIVDLGNFDECVDVENVKSDWGVFSGQHCMVELLHDGAGIAVDDVIVSVCVPSSCRAGDVAAHFRRLLPMMRVQVTDAMCNTRVTSKNTLTALDCFAIAVLLVLVALEVFSTLCHSLVAQPGRHRELLLVFSVFSNGRKLLNTRADTDSLSAVHGVRFLSMVWVIVGHRYLYSAMMPAVNSLVTLEQNHDWPHMLVTNASVSVDSFFLLSGLLLSYVVLKGMDAGAPFNVLTFYLHRYVRLTPAFALTILLSVTLVRYIGDGPYWRMISQNDANTCAVSWWAALLYVNNYVHADNVCLQQSWYLAVDMQLYWISPLILYPLAKWPRIGKCLLGVSSSVGLAIAFLIPYLNQFGAGPVLNTDEMNAKEYIATHARFTPWLIGIALGYILHKTKARDIYLCPVAVVLGWVLSGALMMTALLLKHRFMAPGHEYERLLESLYKCLMRPAWALGLAWVVFACVKGYGGFVNAFLSWKVFRVLGRFTYTAYLVHVRMVIWATAGARSAQYLSDINVISQAIADLCFSMTAAVILSLLIESPIIALEKFITSRSETSPEFNPLETPEELVKGHWMRRLLGK